MLQKVPDRRVQKTRQLLQDALIKLIAEKGYQFVTVQDILNRANVGRSTFYAHFQSKDQLLYSCFDTLNKLFEQHSKRLSKGQKNSGDNNTGLTLGIFQFAGKNHGFFKALLGKQGKGTFNRIMYDFVLTQSHEHIKILMSHEKHGLLKTEIVTHYLVSAIMGVLVWWVDKDMPCTAEEIDGLLKQLAIPGFKEVLGLNDGAKL